RTVRKDRSYPTAYQVGRKCGQAIILILRPTILNYNITALHIADLFKALPERARHGCIAIRGCAVQKADYRHCQLLRARCQRPRSCRAAEQRDELASLHQSTRGWENRPSALRPYDGRPNGASGTRLTLPQAPSVGPWSGPETVLIEARVRAA